jgi:hypothetical protein
MIGYSAVPVQSPVVIGLDDELVGKQEFRYHCDSIFGVVIIPAGLAAGLIAAA